MRRRGGGQGADNRCPTEEERGKPPRQQDVALRARAADDGHLVSLHHRDDQGDHAQDLIHVLGTCMYSFMYIPFS